MNAARCHALMRCFDHHANTLRVQDVPDAICDLRGHLLLHLKAASECLDNACEFADADDFLIRQVANMRVADDRRHVVFAMGFELDVTQHDHLIVAVKFFECTREKLDRIFLVAAEPVLVGAGDPRGCINQSFPARVFAGP